MYKIYNEDNLNISFGVQPNLIYADMIYENIDLSWLYKYWNTLSPDGIFIIQTDWHTDWLIRNEFETKIKKDENFDTIFVNHLIWKNEWGNHPKNKFHQCYDSIIIYAKGKNYKFYPERIQVNKVTKNKGLNPSGRETKAATAWIDDICLTTTSKERIKKPDGHLIQWQKPLKLFDRIILPFTDEKDLVVDPFMGSGSLSEWCIKNNRDYVGIEYDKEVFDLAKNRIENLIKF